MNTGAFGEGFPYSNFHDLNMDWIIKIAKDFLDQYTHLQETIANGEESLSNLTAEGLEALQSKADALEALLQAWYDEHSEDIADALAQALSDLNTWYEEHQGYLDQELAENILEFNSRAEAKAESVIESIPSDYTALTEKVALIEDATVRVNTMDIIPEEGQFIDAVFNGITYAWTNRTCHASGTATSGTYNTIINSQNALPDVIIPGKHINIMMDRTSNNINLQLYWYANGSAKPVINITANTVLQVPLDATGMLLRLYIANGVTVDDDITVTVTDAFTDDQITTMLADIEEEVIPYNAVNLIGEYGQRNPSTFHGITYAWNGNKCTITGTSNDASYNTVLTMSNGLPGNLQPGDILTIDIQRSTSNIEMQLFWKINGVQQSAISVTSTTLFVIPENTTGILLRIYIQANTNVNGYIIPAVLSAPSNKSLMNELLNTLHKIPMTSSIASSDYNSDIQNLPEQCYCYILPSWFNISDALYNSGSWLFKITGVNSSLQFYLMLDVVNYILYLGKLSNGTVVWRKLTNDYLNKKIANFGDSITWGRDGNGASTDQTTFTVSHSLNMLFDVSASNYGVGGMGYYETAGGMTAIDKLQSVDLAQFDIITLMYGANDNSAVLGSYTDTTQDSMIGAMYRCWDYIRTQNRRAVVIFIAPINASSFGTQANGYWYGYKRGPLYDYNLTQLVEEMRKFCAKYHIPFIDNLDTFDLKSLSSVLPDGVHPSNYGYQIMSCHIAREIGKYI